MKKNITLILFIILTLPTLTFADLISFKVGYFIPRAESDLWQDEFNQMSFSKTDFHATNLGFSYEYFFSNQLSVALTIDAYSKKKMGSYVDYVGLEFEEGDFAFPADYEGDFQITHVFDVSITPIQASLKLTPLGRRGRFIPFVGGGAGVYLWNVRLIGEIIDFSDVWYYYDPYLQEDIEVYPVIQADAREEGKVNIGFHAFGGIMFPIASRISIEAEFKYNFLKGKLTEGFEGFAPFDLGGYQVSLGLNYWF